MAVFALVHGGWQGGWCWDLLAAELIARGHTCVAPDLPATDPAAGAAEYARTVLDALPGPDEVVLVAHSLGGLVAPLVAAAGPVRRVVYVAAMLPAPGRSVDERARAGERMTRRGIGRGQTANADGSTSWRPQAAVELLYPDSPPERAAAAAARLRPSTGGSRPSRARWRPGRTCPRRTCSAGRTGSSTPAGPGPRPRRTPSWSSCPVTTRRSWPARPRWPTCWAPEAAYVRIPRRPSQTQVDSVRVTSEKPKSRSSTGGEGDPQPEDRAGVVADDVAAGQDPVADRWNTTTIAYATPEHPAADQPGPQHDGVDQDRDGHPRTASSV